MELRRLGDLAGPVAEGDAAAEAAIHRLTADLSLVFEHSTKDSIAQGRPLAEHKPREYLFGPLDCGSCGGRLVLIAAFHFVIRFRATLLEILQKAAELRCLHGSAV